MAEGEGSGGAEDAASEEVGRVAAASVEPVESGGLCREESGAASGVGVGVASGVAAAVTSGDL